MATSKTHWYLLGPIKYPPMRWPMPEIHTACRAAPIGYFWYFFPVTFTLASNIDKLWSISIILQIQMDPPTSHLVSMLAYYALVTNKTLYPSRCSMPGHWTELQSSKVPCPFPSPGQRQGPSAAGWSFILWLLWCQIRSHSTKLWRR